MKVTLAREVLSEATAKAMEDSCFHTQKTKLHSLTNT